MCNRKNSKSIGVVSETMVIAALTNCGYTVSLTYGDNASYDLVADMNGKLFKIQVKTAFDDRDGAIYVKASSSQKKIINKVIVGNSFKMYTNTEIDYIACYSRIYNRVYLIPIDDIVLNGKCSFKLRVLKWKNKTRKRCPPAIRYEIFRF